MWLNRKYNHFQRTWRLLILASLSTLSLSACQKAPSDTSVPYHMVDQPLVDKALQIYSGNGKIPKERVDREVYAVVVHLPDMSCVGLNLKPGMAGGDRTICFRNSDGEKVIHLVNGE